MNNPNEVVEASVVEVPKPIRPKLYGVLESNERYFAPTWTIKDGALSQIEPDEGTFVVIPASNSPPPPKRMTEAECRERAENYVVQSGMNHNSPNVEWLVAFAKSLNVVEDADA